MILELEKRLVFNFVKVFSYEIKRPSSTKDKKEIEIEIWKILTLFLKMWKIEVI